MVRKTHKVGKLWSEKKNAEVENLFLEEKTQKSEVHGQKTNKVGM